MQCADTTEVICITSRRLVVRWHRRLFSRGSHFSRLFSPLFFMSWLHHLPLTFVAALDFSVIACAPFRIWSHPLADYLVLTCICLDTTGAFALSFLNKSCCTVLALSALWLTTVTLSGIKVCQSLDRPFNWCESSKGEKKNGCAPYGFLTYCCLHQNTWNVILKKRHFNSFDWVTAFSFCSQKVAFIANVGPSLS